MEIVALVKTTPLDFASLTVITSSYLTATEVVRPLRFGFSVWELVNESEPSAIVIEAAKASLICASALTLCQTTIRTITSVTFYLADKVPNLAT